MKVVFIIGDSAVGKMTVGQSLAEKADFVLVYNHLFIEPIIEIYGYYKKEIVSKMRDMVFEDLAKVGENVIITIQIDFNAQRDLDYIESIKQIFVDNAESVEFYYVELDCAIDERLRRNKTENRLLHKKSKRDIFRSEYLLVQDSENKRCVSNDEDIKSLGWNNYIRVDNTNMSEDAVSDLIIERFDF